MRSRGKASRTEELRRVEEAFDRIFTSFKGDHRGKQMMFYGECNSKRDAKDPPSDRDLETVPGQLLAVLSVPLILACAKSMKPWIRSSAVLGRDKGPCQSAGKR